MAKSLSKIKAHSSRRAFLCVAMCLFSFFTASAQMSNEPEKTITTTRMLGIGYNNTQDTYLSPEDYGGMELRYISHTMRENGRSPFTGKLGKGDWTRLIVNEGFISKGQSRSERGSMIGGAYHFQYGIMHRKCMLDDRLEIHAGTQGELLGGFIYSTRNGNNPAQMRANIALGPVIHARYLAKGLTFDYEASCPLVGLTFSPAYGQSYYEIFDRGDYDHNIVPTTIVSTPTLRQAVTCTFPIRSISLTIGYLGDYRQQQVNSLKQHIYSHNIIIGISRKQTVSASKMQK